MSDKKHIQSTLLEERYMRFVKQSLYDASDIDNEELFRVNFLEYVDFTTEDEEDEYFNEAIPYIRFLNPNDKEHVAFVYPGDTRIYLNCPCDQLGKNKKQWEFAFEHECLHLLWETFEVEKQLVKEEGSNFDHTRLNIASDCVINDYLGRIRGKDMPDWVVTPASLKQETGIDYDPTNDTQYTLYKKLKGVKLNKLTPKLIQKLPPPPPGGGPQPPQPPIPDDYKKGWSDGISDVLNGRVDPLKYKPKKPKNAQDYYTQGYNDVLAEMKEGLENGVKVMEPPENGGGGGQDDGLRKIPWDIPPEEKKDNKSSGGGGGSGDSDSSDNQNQNQDKSPSQQAQDSADKAKQSADNAQKSADDAKQNGDSNAGSKQDAADRAKAAADNAQKHADKAKQAEQDGDDNRAKSEADAAAKAADMAEQENKNAGGDPAQGEGEGGSSSQQAQDAANKAQQSANNAQNAADEAKQNGDPDAGDKQAAADRAKDAANEAQQHAAKSKAAEKGGDQQRAQSEAQAAKDAANKAEQANQEAGGESVSSSSSSSQNQSSSNAQKSASKAKANASHAQDAADEAKQNGDPDAAEKQKAADEAKKAAQNAEAHAGKAKAAEKAGAKKLAEEEAKKAEEEAKKAEKANKKAGGKKVEDHEINPGKEIEPGKDPEMADQNSGGVGGPYLPHHETQEDLDQMEREWKSIIKRFSHVISGDLGGFLKKCKASFERKPEGLKAAVQRGNTSWNQEMHRTIHRYLSSKTKRIEHERSYSRVKRGTGFVKMGDPIKPGSVKKHQALTIDGAFYVDSSGSMDGCIDQVFDAAYAIADSIKKTYKNNKAVDKIDFKMFYFDYHLHELEWGRKVRADGGTMSFEMLLNCIKKHSKDRLINVIITDAGFSGSNMSDFKKLLKDIDGIVFFVSNCVEPDIKKIADDPNNNLYYIQADSNFTVKNTSQFSRF